MAVNVARLFQNCRNGFSQQNARARNASILCKKLVFNEYGDPNKVISLVEEEIDDQVSGKEVLVKMLAAPLNPADINTVQGKYPIKADSLPFVLGNEGLGEVLAAGAETVDMFPGDLVIPFHNKFGTCRSHVRTTDDQLIKIRNAVPLIEAATMAINPCSAYRMLNDFVVLEDGDVVLQNGANSAVGQAVIQLCRCFKVRSVNVVRDRDNLQQLTTYLKNLGADEVITEQQLRTTDLFSSGRLPSPVLALNCVGGPSATELTRHLSDSGKMVTYGAMARAPLQVAAANLIFRNIRLYGFWMTRWTDKNLNSRARWEMLDQIQSLSINRRFLAPRHTRVLIDNYSDAIALAMRPEGKVDSKQILVFDESLVTAGRA